VQDELAHWIELPAKKKGQPIRAVELWTTHDTVADDRDDDDPDPPDTAPRPGPSPGQRVRLSPIATG
jgi:hypothetical protein